MGTAPPSADRLGPFDPNLDPAEMRARLRDLKALACIECVPRAADLVKLLAQAEADAAALELFMVTLDRLPSHDRRYFLSSHADLHRPAA